MPDQPTTIQLKRSVVKALNGVKKYDRETYNEVILDLINFVKSTKMSEQYNEFIEMAQRQKMREMWENREDEVWENA